METLLDDLLGHGDGVAVGERTGRGRCGRRLARRELVAPPSASAVLPRSLGALALAVMATWPAIALDAVGAADRRAKTSGAKDVNWPSRALNIFHRMAPFGHVLMQKFKPAVSASVRVKREDADADKGEQQQ